LIQCTRDTVGERSLDENSMKFFRTIKQLQSTIAHVAQKIVLSALSAFSVLTDLLHLGTSTLKKGKEEFPFDLLNIETIFYLTLKRDWPKLSMTYY
jgi:hypothetical protein